MTTIIAILLGYGFSARANGTYFWGVGSLVWGHTASVSYHGNDLYEVVVRHWFYNEYGDCVRDDRKVVFLHGARLLELVFTEMPLW